jgi:hypothetical protein
MKTLLKQRFSLLAVFLLFASTSVVAQQSDYQIQQDFRAELSELMERVESAVSTAELSELEAEIDRFETQYAEHSQIINSAIYPDTFNGSLTRLKNAHSAAMDDASIIEQLNQRIDELTAEMDVFRDRMEEMNVEMSSLQNQLERAEANETRQAALLRQYRQNIDQRNEFGSEFLEELLSKYQTMDRTTQQEIAEAAERLDDNPLEMIQTIVIEYIDLADQETALETPDFVAMRAQHGYFEDIWGRIGERLANTFEPENPVTAKEEIDDLLTAWLLSVDNQLWNALESAFSQNGIELEPFASADDFNTALNSYVDNAYEISLERNSEEDHEIYRNFSNFWNNTVKASWGELLVEGNVLSHTDIAAIDLKIADWSDASAPTSNLMFILLLISIAIIIGLVILLITKTGKAPAKK